jgi:hypothetical protein
MRRPALALRSDRFAPTRRGSRPAGAPAGSNYLAILGVTPAMSRMPQMADPRTIGPSFHTADQADQRIYLGAGMDGRDAFNADPAARPVIGNSNAPGFANVVRTTRHPDGTCDSVRLEATQDGWIDLGGATPRDFRVVSL